MPAAVAVAAIVVSAIGTAVSISAQQDAADRAEQQAKENAEAQARYELEQAQAKAAADEEAAAAQAADETTRAAAEAQRIRTAAQRMIKSQTAASAASGLLLDTGAASDIVTETNMLASQDVATVLDSGKAQAKGLISDAQKQGNLLIQSAQGRGGLLRMDAEAQGAAAHDKANAASVNSIFSFANTALSAVGTYQHDQNMLEVERQRNQNLILQHMPTRTSGPLTTESFFKVKPSDYFGFGGRPLGY